MSAYDINIAQLKSIALALDDLLIEVTFVGGCTTALLVDAFAFFGVRQTDDVDVIVNITTYVGYQHFSEQLRERGFIEDVEGPTCRWLWRDELGTIRLDVMPIDESALGFSNCWYPEAIENSTSVELDTNIEISVVAPVFFLATKFEAFIGRGNGDYFSHDLEDIVFVLENRSNILREVLDASLDVKEYLASKATELLNDDFLNVLPGILNNADSASEIENMLGIIARSADV